MFVVLSGRLRRVDHLTDGSRRIVGELGRGDLVGFLEVVSCQPHIYTVMAIRYVVCIQIDIFKMYDIPDDNFFSYFQFFSM